MKLSATAALENSTTQPGRRIGIRWQNGHVDFTLHPIELRVLGSLLEKDITTPEYYPLTVNALVAACNQKSNRDPVVNYDDDIVHRGLESLRAKGLAAIVTGGHNRVPKHAHRISDRLNLGRRELAILCELMLRGPQTLGELRNRGARMYEFSDLEEVESCLRSMGTREEGALVLQLPQQPGTKEPRWAHLLAGEPIVPAAAPEPPAAPLPVSPSDPGRLERLESEVADLRSEVFELRRQVDEFRRQFE